MGPGRSVGGDGAREECRGGEDGVREECRGGGDGVREEWRDRWGQGGV